MTRFAAPISEQIWDMKYRFKKADGTPIDMTVEDTWRRIARALAECEGNPKQTAESQEKARELWADRFYEALEDWKFVPAGRIVAGAGTARTVTLFNCFVMGTIPDSMDGIFSMLREAALTMQQGGGIGYDFSTIRPRSSWVKGVDSDASGPLSFMDCWDAMCRTVMSAGSRRGAMMATMRCDHPDILDFIEAKRDAKRLRMFNLSVLVTDAFMEAVDENRDWPLVHVEPPTEAGAPILDYEGSTEKHGEGLPRYIHKTVKARDLWNQIMQATYDAAEPGVIFIDRVNDLNNLKYAETISSTNPCGEQPLPPYGACLLGSINLVKMILDPFTPDARLDRELLRKTVQAAVRMMDNVVDVSKFPLEAQRVEAQNKRRIGLGVTGLADALIMLGLTYGSEEAAEMTSAILEAVDRESYWASIYLAQEKGAFPLFDPEQYPAPGSHVARLCEDDPTMAEAIREHGIRNALLTSIAPTGTISLYAGNVSSGIEPVFALSYKRKVLLPDGSHAEELVEDYAVAAYREAYNKLNPDEPYTLEVGLPDYFVTAQTLAPEDHVRMQAAAQRWVDSSISKTVNLPEDISFADFKAVYWDAYEQGCKGCTTYRPNEITGSVLSVDEKPKEELKVEETYLDHYDANTGETTRVRISTTVKPATDLNLDEMLAAAKGYEMSPEEAAAQANSFATANLALDKAEELPKRPDQLNGTTYKIKIGDQSAVYLTVNDMVESDGTVRPFEVFLRSSDPSHDEWMVALARTISAVLRRPYDASFLADELKQVHSTITGGYGMGGYTPSLVAAIGRKLGDHIAALKADNKAIRSVVFSGLVTREQAEAVSLYRLEDSAQLQFSFLVNDDPIPQLREPIVVKGKPCPKCHGYNFKHENGCPTCLDCGWSKCG